MEIHLLHENKSHLKILLDLITSFNNNFHVSKWDGNVQMFCENYKTMAIYKISHGLLLHMIFYQRDVCFLSPNNFKYFVYRVISLLTIISFFFLNLITPPNLINIQGHELEGAFIVHALACLEIHVQITH